MPTLLENVGKTAQQRAQAAQDFRHALIAARQAVPPYSWAELAKAAGMSRAGVRHLVNNTKGENTP